MSQNVCQDLVDNQIQAVIPVHSNAGADSHFAKHLHTHNTHTHIHIDSQCLESGWSIKSLADIPAIAIRWWRISSSEGGSLGSNGCTDNLAISGGPRLRFIPPSCCQSWEASELLDIDIAGDMDCSLGGGSLMRGLSVWMFVCMCMY